MIDFGGPRAASSVGPVVCFVPLFEPAPIDELPHFVSKLRKIAGQGYASSSACSSDFQKYQTECEFVP